MYDFIVVGAGSAGCVLANRLSADGRTRVLLIEAGSARIPKESKIPAAFSKLFHTAADWDFSTEPEPNAGDRRMYWPRGKLLGGSSAMNAMMYVRGHRSDYDQWRQLGNAGWSYDDVLPYFKRSEAFRGKGAVDGYHGYDGPLQISDQPSPNPMTLSFLEAGQQLGLRRRDDVNGPQQDGVGLTHVTQRSGARMSAADAFLTPARGRTNLQIETDALVERVVLDGRRATGITYVRSGERKTASAGHVILAAGAIGSPHLLMLSGVGPAAHLREHGVAVVLDSPGVGQNLQDHLASGVGWHCTQPLSLFSAEGLGNLARYLFLGRGPLTSNVAEAFAFVHTRPGLSAADVELLFAPTFFVDQGAGNPEGHGFTVACILLRPESRGSISLKSSDPAAAPAIRANYLATDIDRNTMIAGVRWARRMASASAFDAYRGAEYLPGESVKSDAALLDYVRQRSQTLYHPVGTCRMGTDSKAVVDPTLAVKGISGLSVADCSIMPTIIGGHTHAPAMMIGEKAADFLLQRSAA